MAIQRRLVYSYAIMNECERISDVVWNKISTRQLISAASDNETCCFKFMYACMSVIKSVF